MRGWDEQSGRALHRRRPELEGHLAARRRRVGRLRQRQDRGQGSFARYVAGQAIAFANQVNPVRVLTAPTRAPGPTSTATACRSTITATSSSTSWATRRRRRRSVATLPTTSYDPDLLTAGASAATTTSSPLAAQHQLADRVSVNGGCYRRTFGNQTFTDDLRYDGAATTDRSASPRRPTATCRAAAAIRCAACTT